MVYTFHLRQVRLRRSIEGSSPPKMFVNGNLVIIWDQGTKKGEGTEASTCKIARFGDFSENFLINTDRKGWGGGWRLCCRDLLPVWNLLYDMMQNQLHDVYFSVIPAYMDSRVSRF